MTSMTSFNIGELQVGTPHLMADLAELLLLLDFNGRKVIHRNELASIIEQGAKSVETIDAELIDEARESDAEIRDSLERNIDFIWGQLEYRESSLNEFYPYFIHGDELYMLNSLTDCQKIYCFLTCCSRLRSFSAFGSINLVWAKYFTNLCKEAVKALAPASPRASVRIFDVGSPDRYSYYGTDLRLALPVLGKDLGVIGCNDANCKQTSSGDGGFDLIVNYGFDDNITSNFAILGQCGAQETEWPSKTLESNSIHLRHYFQTNFDFPSVMFTPVFYRQANGRWVNERHTNGVLLLDRQRILTLIKDMSSARKITSSDWFINYELWLSKMHYSIY
ncbi:hypothetical protein [Atlantibacter hermannii]|uniref:hypothetical protein n=1 Tax=Atlantibacter hermannii TaxID=565 RepID=UPI0028984069|nr:hypothetical protein [Atlantibacter hermannii]